MAGEKASRPSPPAELKALLDQAAAAYSAGRLTEAVAAFQFVALQAPRHESTWVNLGVAWRQLKKPELSIACYHRVLELNPDNAGVWTNLGNALKDVERLDEALVAHRRAVELDPSKAMVWHFFGVCLWVVVVVVGVV